MAGPFRGVVGKLKKQKSKGKKGKTSHSLVKRSRKLSAESIAARVDALLGTEPTDTPLPSGGSSATSSSSFLAKVKPVKSVIVSQTAAGKVKMLEVVKQDGKKERVVERADQGPERTPQEALGLRLLHQAVKTQSHNRTLPHQQRHDYEFRLRRLATLGVVRLFNSLAQSQTAGDQALDEEKTLTMDKAQEKKLVASRDAFLAALRKPGTTVSDFY